MIGNIEVSLQSLNLFTKIKEIFIVYILICRWKKALKLNLKKIRRKFAPKLFDLPAKLFLLSKGFTGGVSGVGCFFLVLNKFEIKHDFIFITMSSNPPNSFFWLPPSKIHTNL